MAILITPTAIRVHDLKRAAKENKGKTPCLSLNARLEQIAFEELKRVDKILMTSYVTRRSRSGETATIEYFQPNNCWELLMSECWTLDTDARELRSNPPQIARGQVTRRPPMVISWAMSLSISDTVPELEIDRGKVPGHATLSMLPTIERRGPGDYPIVIHVGVDSDCHVPVSDPQTVLLQSDSDLDRGAALIVFAQDMRQRCKDIAEVLVVDDRADLEMQCADLHDRKRATCLLMLGPLHGVPGFMAAYLMQPVLPSDEPCVGILNLSETEVFSIAQLSLLAWNAIVAEVSDTPGLCEDNNGNQVSVPIRGQDFLSLREAVFHGRHVGPRFIYEEAPWIVDRVPSPIMARVAAITDGEQEGWIMSLESQPA
ncbi:hypothetical protein [Ruegeria sp. HKCCA6837]|uniref:hypothetical protein n=1 Tax=Ruegeria sp. HKCCA6837 TaxID=2682989 RepID=UPI001489E332|nr:hypothetical protein [Ruegeria sp. HKCCA6837]